MRAAALLPGAARRSGPMTPAQLSQYARRSFVTDILAKTVAGPRGSTKLRADAPCPKTYDLGKQESGVRNQESVKLRSCRRERRLLLFSSLLHLLLTTLLRGRQWVFRRRLRITPGFLVTQHRPATHQNFARERHDRLLLAPLTAAGQPQVKAARPAVVTQHAPGAFHQQLTQQRRATLGDASAPIQFARLM